MVLSGSKQIHSYHRHSAMGKGFIVGVNIDLVPGPPSCFRSMADAEESTRWGRDGAASCGARLSRLCIGSGTEEMREQVMRECDVDVGVWVWRRVVGWCPEVTQKQVATVLVVARQR